MPPWANMGTAKYAQFTKATGIKVDPQFLAFDEVHDKSVTALASGAAPADIIEVDSLWVGQYGAAHWLTPLKSYLPAAIVKSAAARSIFTISGKLLAMPYNLDYRWVAVNASMLKHAGITTLPRTWSALRADAIALKSKHIVEYPVAMPLSVTAETVESWLNLTISSGGSVLNASGKPAFVAPTSPGFRAMEFLRSLYTAHLVNPASVSLSGEQAGGLFASGKAAFDMRSGPSVIGMYKDPKASRVWRDRIEGVAIGRSTPSMRVYGLPEGMGIPITSKHKAAAAMFIDWYNQIPQEVFSYLNPPQSLLPAQFPAIDALISKRKLVVGREIRQYLPHVKPLFPKGAPTWWPQFANDAATAIQSVVTGQTSVKSGLEKLGQETTALINQQ